MYVVWGQIHPTVQWFAIGTFPWQHLDQFEENSFAINYKRLKTSFFNMKK
jgi:hypothetical protein